MKLLLTGFEPFGGSAVNPSQQVVGALADRADWPGGGVRLLTAILPVDGRAPDLLLDQVREHEPDAIVCLGEARRAAISIERVFINLVDYRIADNAGRRVEEQSIVIGGPAAYFSTLPVRRLYEAVKLAGIAVSISNSAGTFLCNQISYALLHHLDHCRRQAVAGFIHVPRLPEQAAEEAPRDGAMADPDGGRGATAGTDGRLPPAMDLETTCRGVRAAIDALITWRRSRTPSSSASR